MVFILDSDHISLLLRQDPKVSAKLAQEINQAAVTIITVQEVCNGWLGLLNQKNQNRGEMLHRYHQFWLAIDFFKPLPILEFDNHAYDFYMQLITDNSALRKQDIQRDLRIAAIALSQNAIVVTRNQKDFRLVPGLQIEDWSV